MSKRRREDKFLEFLLSHVNARDRRIAPLHLACMYGYDEVVAKLLASGSDIEARDSQDRTPLHVASQCIVFHDDESWTFDYSRTVWTLLLKGANVNAVDVAGDTPLHLAARFSRCEIICSLLSAGARHDICNAKGETPLFDSCRQGNAMAISMFLKKDACLATKNNDGYDVLYFARESKTFPETMPLLLSHQKTEFGRAGLGPCLLHACLHGHTSMVLQLLKQENIDIEALGYGGNTPLHLACVNGHVDIVYALLDRKANVSAVNTQLNTPLHLASKFELKMGLEEFYLSRKKASEQLFMISALLDRGAPVNVQNARGKTPLFYAVTRPLEKSALLLTHGADPNLKNVNGFSPLQKASGHGRDSVIPLLLKAGARIDDEDNTGKTALYYACITESPSTVLTLIRGGANVNCTVSTFRKADCSVKILSYLLRAGATVKDLDFSLFELACLKGDLATIEREAPKELDIGETFSAYRLGFVSVVITLVAFSRLDTFNNAAELSELTCNGQGIFFLPKKERKKFSLCGTKKKGLLMRPSLFLGFVDLFDCYFVLFKVIGNECLLPWCCVQLEDLLVIHCFDA